MRLDIAKLQADPRMEWYPSCFLFGLRMDLSSLYSKYARSCMVLAEFTDTIPAFWIIRSVYAFWDRKIPPHRFSGLIFRKCEHFPRLVVVVNSDGLTFASPISVLMTNTRRSFTYTTKSTFPCGELQLKKQSLNLRGRNQTREKALLKRSHYN